MDLLQGLMGGGQRQQFEDFANRYERGAPWDDINDDEAMSHYQQVAPRLSRQDYEESAYESFSRLSPDQRRQFGQYVAQRAPEYGVSFPDVNMDGQDDRLQDRRFLAQMTGRIHEQQPGLLGQLLGGGGGGGLGGGMLQSPIAKAALGGIAAMAVRRMMAGR